MKDFCLLSVESVVKKGWSLCILALLVCGLSACQTKAPPVVVEEKAAVVEDTFIEEVDDPLDSEVYQLLLRANQAMVRDHLMKPEKNSAWYWFGEVLKLQPDNVEAKAGIQRMANRYIELAVEAYRSGNTAQAESMLSRATTLGAEKSAVASIRFRMQKGQLFAENEFSLNVSALAERNAEMLQRLNDVAQKIQAKKSRIVIVANNDDDGRWIYQQLRQQLSGYDLRGDIQRGKVPYIELVDW